ncbi:hypothetical protein ACF0H5_022607 [Mactra antiquata]
MDLTAGMLILLPALKERFRKRKSVLAKECEKVQSNERQASWKKEVKFNLKNATGSHVVYCAIEKAGSTFWKRILQVIDKRNNYTSPLDIKTVDAEYPGDIFIPMSNDSWDDIVDVTKKHTSIMFVRNPYTRLFSAWLDKFYSMNIPYWRSVGIQIAQSERNQGNKNCVYDVTFPELVNYVSKSVLSNAWIERHFSPNFRHCDPCHLDFDYIGKYETLNDDTSFILDSLNLTKRINLPKDSAEKDAIKDGVFWAYYQRNDISKCGISFACALFRMWQRLQSRGIISKNIPFPFSSKLEAEAVTMKDFEMTLNIAHGESKKDDIHNNRQESLSQAIRTLPEQVVRRLQRAFLLDFKLFNYDIDKSRYMVETDEDYIYFKDCPSNLL